MHVMVASKEHSAAILEGHAEVKCSHFNGNESIKLSIILLVFVSVVPLAVS